jgi:hypothetical protein
VDKRLLALIAFIAAAPSLARAAMSPLPLVDDWAFIDEARHGGFSVFMHGSDAHSRPLQALSHWLTFAAFGDRMWLHLLLMGALNAVIAVLVARVARRFLPASTSLAVATAWAVLPNHSAIRVWPATTPILLALLLLLLAADLLTRDVSRLPLAAALVGASALAYEGGIGLGFAGLLAFGVAGVRRRAVRPYVVVLCLAAVASVGAWVVLTSPKDALPARAFTPERVPASELGSALLPNSLGGLGLVVIAAVLVALVFRLAPGFRRLDEVRFLVAGLALLVLGVAPFVAARFPLSTDGLLDRGNSFASLGTAVVLVATGRILVPAWRGVRPAVLVAACIVMGVATRERLTSVHRADQDARRLLAALHSLPPVPADSRLVVAPLPAHGGFTSFGYGSVAAAARRELGHPVRISDSLSNREWREEAGLHVRLSGSRLVVDEMITTSSEQG